MPKRSTRLDPKGDMGIARERRSNVALLGKTPGTPTMAVKTNVFSVAHS